MSVTRAMWPWLLVGLGVVGISNTGCSEQAEVGLDGSPPPTAPSPKGARIIKNIAPGRRGGQLTLALASGPTTFNPLMVRDAHTSEVVFYALFSACWAYDYSLQESAPGLCESFERSADGLRYTFTLREGLRWSDGQPITADDAVFTHRAVLDPRTPTHLKGLFQQGKDAAGQPRFVQIERVDARRFTYVLHSPVPQFEIVASSVRILPRHRWRRALDEGRLGDAMGVGVSPEALVSSGPFTLARYTPDAQVTLARNPHFWQVDTAGTRLPYLDAVEYVIAPDPNTAFLLFREGRTHLYDVRSEYVSLLLREAERGGYRVEPLGPSLNTHYLMFNLDPRLDEAGEPRVSPARRAWFEERDFRRAISHAIDRGTMVRTALQGRGRVLHDFISPGNARWSGADVVQYPYDLARSRALLAGLGFTRGEGGRLMGPEGHPVEFSALTNAENTIRVQCLNLIKDDLARLGITMHVRPLPFREMLATLNEHRRFEAVLLGWGSSVPPDPMLLKSVFLSSGSNHIWDPLQESPRRSWEAEMDTLIQQGSGGLDEAARKAAVHKLMRLFSEQLPQIMLVVEEEYAAARANVGNFRPSPLRPKTHWNLEQLFLTGP